MVEIMLISGFQYLVGLLPESEQLHVPCNK
jgi:hypothetical protein